MCAVLSQRGQVDLSPRNGGSRGVCVKLLFQYSTLKWWTEMNVPSLCTSQGKGKDTTQTGNGVMFDQGLFVPNQRGIRPFFSFC